MNDERPSGAAWRLSRVGAAVSQRFAQRLVPLGLTPPEAATLRAVASRDASQRELAESLGLVPSRLVALLDALERRELVRRVEDPRDRRRKVVQLTPTGERTMRHLREVAVEHDADVVAPLNDAEREQLVDLLERLQRHLGIQGKGHPGMQH